VSRTTSLSVHLQQPWSPLTISSCAGAHQRLPLTVAPPSLTRTAWSTCELHLSRHCFASLCTSLCDLAGQPLFGPGDPTVCSLPESHRSPPTTPLGRPQHALCTRSAPSRCVGATRLLGPPGRDGPRGPWQLAAVQPGRGHRWSWPGGPCSLHWLGHKAKFQPIANGNLNSFLLFHVISNLFQIPKFISCPKIMRSVLLFF
jgi:hypothetical protein